MHSETSAHRLHLRSILAVSAILWQGSERFRLQPFVLCTFDMRLLPLLDDADVEPSRLKSPIRSAFYDMEDVET